MMNRAEQNWPEGMVLEINEDQTSVQVLTPFEHELNARGTDCNSDCPACLWAGKLLCWEQHFMTTYPGIDYGLGKSNINTKTGIRYGVISQHSVPYEYQDDFEQYYGEPTCPECGNGAKEYNQVSHEGFASYSEYGCADYACEVCKHTLDSQDVFSEESLGFSYERDGYKLTNALDSDIFVIESPYYTRAQYCSPCVPGAGNLDNPCEDGPKTYCLGHDWFENGKAPYPIYRVSDNSLVEN